MRRDVQAAPAQVITDFLGHLQREGALRVDRVLLRPEVFLQRPVMLDDARQQGQQARLEIGKQGAQLRRRHARLVFEHQRVEWVLLVAHGIGLLFGEIEHLLEIGREAGEVVVLFGLVPDLLGHRRQGGPAAEQIGGDAAHDLVVLPGLLHRPHAVRVRVLAGDLGFSRVEQPRRGVAREMLAREAGERGKLVTACLRSSGRHLRARIPFEDVEHIQDIVQAGDVVLEVIISGHSALLAGSG